MMPRFNSIITDFPQPYVMEAPPPEEPVNFTPEGDNPRSNDPRGSGRYMSEDYYLERNPGKTSEDYFNMLKGKSDSNQLGGERGSKEHNEAVAAMKIELEASRPGYEQKEGFYQGSGRKHRSTGDRARLAANQTQGQSASLLTG